MNKLKIILIISGIVLGMGILVNIANAAGLGVEFEKSPLFDEANFVPGDTITRWVKIGNTSGSTQKIITEAINKNDIDNFSEKLNLIIKEGEITIFNDTLKKFFDQGETYLSDLANNGNTRYDFSITFDANANDNWQGKTLGFDIVIGFQGQEGQSSGGGGTSGGSSGGGVPGMPALTVYNEANSVVTDMSVTIIWTTSYAATSQVIYAAEGEVLDGRSHILDLSDSSGTPPKFGYAHTTPEYDTITKVVYHSVTITGLISGTIYYYRAVSHGSLAVGQEFSFTTSGIKPANLQTGIGTTETGTGGTTTGTGEVAGATTEEQEEQGLEEKQGTGNEEVPRQETKFSLLAAVGNILSFGTGNAWLAVIIGIIILALLIFIVFRITKGAQKRNFEKNLKK